MKTTSDKSQYLRLSGNDMAGSLFPITNDLDVDHELVCALKKCHELNITADVILSQFGLVLGRSVSTTEHVHTCPKCSTADSFHICLQDKGWVRWFCSSCNCQKKYGDCLISLLHLYYGEAVLPRRQILNQIKLLISRVRINKTESTRKQREKFVAKWKRESGVHAIEQPETKKSKTTKGET